MEKQSIKLSEELDSKTKRLNILMNKHEKLNRNIEVCDNLEKKYEEISTKNEDLKTLNQQIQHQIRLFTTNA